MGNFLGLGKKTLTMSLAHVRNIILKKKKYFNFLFPVGYLTEGMTMHQPSLVRREEGEKVAQWMLSGRISIFLSIF